MIDRAQLLTLLRSAAARKYLRRFVYVVAAIGVLGFFVLPPLVKSIVLDQVGQALHRPVAVKHVAINPYALSLTLEGVSIGEREGTQTFASFDRLYVNLQSTSVFRFGPVIGELRLENPRLSIVRLADKRYNFSDLLDEFLAKPKNDDPMPRFSVGNIQVSGGAIEFDDRALDEKHVVSEIALTLPFISSMAYAVQSFVEPTFAATIDGAPLLVKGKSKLFADTLESEINIDISKVQLREYVDYLPVKLPIKLVSGSLDSALKVTFLQAKDQPSTLIVSGTSAIRDLDVKDTSGAPLLSLKQLDLSLASADLLGRKFIVDRLLVDTPQIYARVSREGSINWVEFFSKQLAASAKSGEKSAPSPAPAWSLGEAKVAGGVVRWLDESHGKPFNASVEGIALDLKKLDSQGKAPAEFDLSWRLLADEWLRIDEFAVKGGRLDLGKREVNIGQVLVHGARSLVRRSAQGKLEWLEPPSLRVVEAAQKDVATPWKVTVAKYQGDDFAVRFEDHAVSPAATQKIEGLSIEAENLSTVDGQVAKLAARFKFNGKGQVAVDGSIDRSALDAKLMVDVKTLELLPLQPYFAEKLNIDVTRGNVTLAGKLNLHLAEAAKPAAGAGPGDPAQPVLSGGFSGQATLGDFQAVDKINSADFLRWKSFFLGKVDVRLNPDSVSIGEVALSDFFARVIVSPEGKLNLLQIVRHGDVQALVPEPVVADATPAASAVPAPVVVAGDGKAVAAVASAAAAPELPISIGKITLQGGTVRFTDNFVKPNYSANLRQIGGSISGLSSQAGSVAKLELRGSYDNVAPLTISAQINPLVAKRYLDLQAEIKGIELTSLSSYSAKYAGYAIEKGKLSLFVKYKIENDQLTAENRVFLDQLTFGDAVDSPDATKLPVTLAVSLLKNRAGEIDIDLPISGSLNDPQFSVGGLVVKVIVNLLMKAVTSPFALLGSMFAGDQEMAIVEFDYGRATLTSVAEKRIAALAQALNDRPALKLEVEGRVDPERDSEGLKEARIERKVRALKREDLTKNSVESGSAETVVVSDEEYPELLERVFRAEKFPKPRNMVGLVKSLPVAEMEKLMLANSTIDNDDLIDLGDRRARTVRDWLLGHGVAGERVFLLPSKPVAAPATGAADDKQKGSRVDFSLK